MTLDDNHRSDTNVHECVHTYILQYSLCGCSRSKVHYTTKNWISHLTNYCMLSWRSPTNRDWTALLLAHVHQSSMAVYNWSTRSTVRRHQLSLGHDVRMKRHHVFHTSSMKRMTEHQKVQESICIKLYHNRAAKNTRQCTPTHNQPQSVKSQKGT